MKVGGQGCWTQFCKRYMQGLFPPKFGQINYNICWLVLDKIFVMFKDDNRCQVMAKAHMAFMTIHPMHISTKFSIIWTSSFREQMIKMKLLTDYTQSDGNNSHECCVRWGKKLKSLLFIKSYHLTSIIKHFLNFISEFTLNTTFSLVSDEN